jgi:NmrA-like family
MDSRMRSGAGHVEDAPSLTAAFRGAEGVFVLVPPNFDPQPGFPEAQAIGAALRSALDATRPARVVYLCTIGAQASQPNLLTQHTIIEQALSDLPVPITFLRPAWFMQNCRWGVVPACEHGLIPSFLQPLDKPVPMVATAEIGKLAAALLQSLIKHSKGVVLAGKRSDLSTMKCALTNRPMKKELYIGLAVHKDSITVAVTVGSRGGAVGIARATKGDVTPAGEKFCEILRKISGRSAAQSRRRQGFSKRSS